MSAFSSLFPTKKPVLAMLHLKGNTPEERLERAKQEIEIYYNGGADAVVVENYFGNRNDVIAVLQYLQNSYPEKVYGVNLLHNFSRSYELAIEYGAKFMQIDSIVGHQTPEIDEAYGAMIAAYRKIPGPVVLGGVRFKYMPVRSGRTLEEDLSIAKTRCDAVVVTGAGTGLETDDEKIARFRQILGDFPLIIGAGMTADTVPTKMTVGDGAIVGSWMKDNHLDTGEVNPNHVARFMEAVEKIR